MTITIGTQGLVDDDVVWRIAAGADAYATFRLWQDEAKTTPQDLSDVTGSCEIRAKYGTALLATADVTCAADGTVTVHLPAAASTAWSPKQTAAVFDVELQDAGGTVTRLCSGSLDILPNVTTGEA